MQKFINIFSIRSSFNRLFMSLIFLGHLFFGAHSYGADSSDVKICLCMIVKNESAIMRRCLESAQGIIDYISICDTGSQDNTITIIQEFMQDTGIPGVVHNHEWKNFGHNRTLSAKAARESLISAGFSLENTYLLFLDADMLLKVNPEFDKNSLKADAYLMIQQDWVNSYYNLRLAKACFDWKSIGVTHEYWGADGAYKQYKISTLYIDDRHDGGCKADKFPRDIRLLKQGLKDEPHNERYMFYLAQSYQNTQLWDKAIKWYNKRIERGGWDEEIWLSKYMIGQCYDGKGDWDKALPAYLEAFQSRPARAEPLSNIVFHYLSKGKNNIACLFANYGKKISYPDNDVLFVEHDVYKFKLLHALSVGYYYTQFRSKGLKYLDKLLLNKQSPDYIKQNSYSNLYHYVENLENTKFISIEPEKTALINDWSTDRFMPMNPCIHKRKNGYLLNCRTVNYYQKYPNHLRLADDGWMRTKNIVIEFDENLNKVKEIQVIDNPNLVKYTNDKQRIQGLEDMRLFTLNEEIYFTATTCQLHPGGLPQICLGKLHDFGNGYMFVDKITLLKGPNPDRCEKNWLPFVIDGDLFVIYMYDPYIIYKVNMDTGDCMLVQEKKYDLDFSKFRGSAAPIPFDNGYLLAVHEVIWIDRGYYVNRFMYLDQNLEIKKISRPFTFKHKGVEFCAGMAFDEANDNLIISLGIEDREACLCLVDAGYVRSLLDPI